MTDCVVWGKEGRPPILQWNPDQRSVGAGKRLRLLADSSAPLEETANAVVEMVASML